MQSWLIPLLGLLCAAALGTGQAAPTVMDLQPRGVDLGSGVGAAADQPTAKEDAVSAPREG